MTAPVTPQPGDICLTVRQPWAWCMIRPDLKGAIRELAMAAQAAGRECVFKDVENRVWDGSARRGRCWIHTSKTMSSQEHTDVRWFLKGQGIDVHLPEFEQSAAVNGLHLGRIVGSIQFNGAPDTTSPWYMGDKGFGVINPITLEEPVPYKGVLGFFKLTAEGLGL